MRVFGREASTTVRALVKHSQSIEAVHGLRGDFGFHIHSAHDVIVSRIEFEVVDR